MLYMRALRTTELADPAGLEFGGVHALYSVTTSNHNRVGKSKDEMVYEKCDPAVLHVHCLTNEGSPLSPSLASYLCLPSGGRRY